MAKGKNLDIWLERQIEIADNKINRGGDFRYLEGRKEILEEIQGLIEKGYRTPYEIRFMDYEWDSGYGTPTNRKEKK